MHRSANIVSEAAGTSVDFIAGSSPTAASTPPSLAVPAKFACRIASMERSSPGPLPYQMAATPSYLPPGYMVACCAPQHAVAARSSLTAEWKKTLWASSSFVARHDSLSMLCIGEPR